MTENYMVMGQRQGDKGLKPHNELQMICPKAHFMVAFQNTLIWSFQCVSNIAEFSVYLRSIALQ